MSSSGFEAGKSYQLHWTTVTGNRVAAGGGGWEESSKVIAASKADPAGRVEFRFNTPDDLGGTHGLWMTRVGKRQRHAIGGDNGAADGRAQRAGRH